MSYGDPFYIRGFTAATAATASHVIASIWNPGTVAGRRVSLVEAGIFKAGAGAANDSVFLARITARGTAGSSLTATAANAGENDSAPPSGLILDLAAFTVQPTLQAAPYLTGWVAPAVAGGGIILPVPRTIVIPAGTGIAICQRAATAWPTSEVYFVVED